MPEVPVGAADVPVEEGLWQWLQAQDQQGARALALPHNSNASKGRMFPATDHSDKPIDRDYAQLRGQYERAIEMMQVKGNSEVSSQFWAADEFANFENAPSIAKFSDRVPMKENYVRYGVVQGLADEARLGVNPFKLGFVGGTDSHNGLMGDTDEDNFVGGHGAEDATPERRQSAEVGGWLAARDQSPGSLTAVWAGEQYPRGDMGRHLRPGGLRHQRAAHGGSLLRGLGLPAGHARAGGCHQAGLCRRRAHGRRTEEGWQEGA